MSLIITYKSVSNIFQCTKILVHAFHITSNVAQSCHLEHSPNAKLSKSIIDRYLCLPIPECLCQAKYIWIDGTGENVRSKTRTLDFIPTCYKECPNWSFDGSSTFQAGHANSDMTLCPCALYNDPIRRGNNKLVLCETYTPEHKPAATNHRAACVELLNKVCEHEPMFGFEQEFQMMDVDKRPYGWPIMLGEPAAVGPYYCGVGATKVYGRDIVECHYRACLYAGVQIFGSNAEVSLSQWEYQIGTGYGIKAADDLWIARFLMERIAEDFGIVISLDPKILPNYNGAGCHTNVSTKDMRADGGIKSIERAICLLEKQHAAHLKMYDPKGGIDNIRRLTGKHETSSIDKFTTAVASRVTSVRIPRMVSEAQKGYFEDRRPASNCDPYAVMYMIVKTILVSDTPV